MVIDNEVIAAPGEDHVRSFPAVEVVVAAPAEENVVTLAAEQCVVATPFRVLLLNSGQLVRKVLGALVDRPCPGISSLYGRFDAILRSINV